MYKRLLYEWVGGTCWDVDFVWGGAPVGNGCKINVVVFIVIQQGMIIVGGGFW